MAAIAKPFLIVNTVGKLLENGQRIPIFLKLFIIVGIIIFEKFSKILLWLLFFHLQTYHQFTRILVHNIGEDVDRMIPRIGELLLLGFLYLSFRFCLIAHLHIYLFFAQTV